MADDTRLNAGTAGDLIATDELTTLNGVAATAGLKVQRVKPGYGLDGAFTDTSFSTPFPVMALANGVISGVNSTAAALGIGGIFSGPAEEITDYADVRVTVFADQPSATDGLQIQQSHNGTNWDISDNYTLPASTGRPFSVAGAARFFRIVYTNGATAQTVFRLQVKFYKGYTKGASVRPQDARSNENDMEEVLSYQMGYNGTSWDRLRSTTANGLAVDVTRVLGSVAVTGTFFQATQPVSALSLPLPTGASTEATLAALNTKVTAVNTGAVVLAAGAATIGAVNIAAAQTLATVTTVSAVTAITNALPTGGNVIGAIAEQRASTLHVSATAAVNTAATASLPAAAAGLFHYITSIQVVKVYNALGVAAGAGVVVTSSNLPGAAAWITEQAAGAVGTAVTVISYQPTTPLKSSVAATISTIACPAQLQTIWRINVSYFTAA